MINVNRRLLLLGLNVAGAGFPVYPAVKAMGGRSYWFPVEPALLALISCVMLCRVVTR